jgi:hypothetical protein
MDAVRLFTRKLRTLYGRESVSQLHTLEREAEAMLWEVEEVGQESNAKPNSVSVSVWDAWEKSQESGGCQIQIRAAKEEESRNGDATHARTLIGRNM